MSKILVFLLATFLMVSQSSASNKKLEVYAVTYPPFVISQTEGILIELVQLSKRINLVILPAKRLLKSFDSGEIKVILHTPTHLPQKLKSELVLNPLVNLVDKYAYIHHPKNTKITLGYFRGDNEERSKIGKDQFQRVPIDKASSLISMLLNKRVDMINCLIPMCQYFASQNNIEFKYLDKPSGIQKTMGGFIYNPKKLNKSETNLLNEAINEITQSKSFKKIHEKYARKYSISIDDLLPKHEYLAKNIKIK